MSSNPNQELWVVKVGSSQLGSSSSTLPYLAHQSHQLLSDGIKLIIVTSGAVASGKEVINQPKPINKQDRLHELRAYAALGQSDLMHRWKTAFSLYHLKVAQVLINHADLNQRDSYLNINSTLRKLLSWGAIPIINENDSVADEELRFGDNDRLAGAIASSLEASKLILLTDVEGLLDHKKNLIRSAHVSDRLLDDVAGSGGSLGKGGMVTKIQAARLAAIAGVTTYIAPANKQDILLDIFNKKAQCTELSPGQTRHKAKKRWIYQQQPTGTIHIDNGAKAAIDAGKSLLPIGVKRTTGSFDKGDCIAIQIDGKTIAKGISQYSAAELILCQGHSTAEIANILKHPAEGELIHADLLVNLD